MAPQSINRNIPEQIADRLRREILTGKLPPNTPMREVTIAERFQVSRGPIRDALARLGQEGLLINEPNKGARVAEAPSKILRSLLISLRTEIEVFAMDSMFDSITDEDIERIGEILADMKTACKANDTEALKDHDIHFHTYIIESHDERHLLPLWRPIAMRMMLDYTRHGNLMDAYEEHKIILDAIKSGDKEHAVSYLEANIV